MPRTAKGPPKGAQGRGGGAHTHLTEDEREAAYAVAVKLYRRGHSYVEIGKAIGAVLNRDPLTGPAVMPYIRRMYDDYLVPQREGVQAYIAEKVDQLREVRAEAWAAWEASKADTVRTAEEEVLPRAGKDRDEGRNGGGKNGKGKGKEAEFRAELVKVKRVVVKEGRLPSNAFLQTILQTLEEEAKYLGLDIAAEAEKAAKGVHWTAYLVGQPLPALGEGAEPAGEPLDLGAGELVTPAPPAPDGRTPAPLYRGDDGESDPNPDDDLDLDDLE